MPLNPESTKEQKDALSEALFQHANRMGTMGAAPEDIPEGFNVPTYSENLRPLYDNQLFPSVSTVEDLVRVGYVTPDGQSTPEGEMAIALKDAGGLNEDYTLNDAGRAMLSNRADLLEPENLNLYGKAEELNLDDDGRGAMARFSDGAKELWKATTNLGAALYEEAEPAMGAIKAIGGIAKGPAGVADVISGVQQQLATDYTPEQRAATRIRTAEAIKEFSDQGAYTLLGAGELMMRGAMSTPVGITGGAEVDFINQAQKDSNILATRQARERVLNDVANVSVSEAVDQLTGVTEFVKSYQQAADLLGPERTKEVQAQGKAMGLAASILNPAAPEAIAFGVGFKAARGITAPISGALLRAEQKASRVLAKTEELTALQKQAADYQFAIKTVEQQAARAEETAARLSKRGFVDRANSATTSANAIRRKAQEAGVKLGGLNDEIARVSDDLATLTKDATVADKFNQMLQKAKEVPYMPITVVGQGLEYVGRGMIGIDKGLSKLASKIGVDKAYNAMNKISSLSGLGTVGAAAGLGPAAFIPAAIKATWSTAPFIQGAGRFINLVGKEAMKARADIDFWKRIYAMPNQGPVNRAIAGLMDTVTLGGRVTDFGVRTTKGILAAVPADLAFQYVAEGGKMDAGSIGEALSESVFFGGAGGGLGAITMGSKQKIRSLQNGNALNFYRTLEDPQQRVMFNGMPEDYRRAIGTFSATNPGARVMFTTIGGGGIDPNTNTIYINPNSSNPIKPLVTHEFMHHMMNNGIGEGIVAQLVGDGYQTGGILRTADGKYEPQYEAFKEEYVDRLRQQHAQMIKMREAIGDKIPANEREFQAPSEKYLAEEYFIESNVEDMLGLVESGKLGKMAGRMIINDKVRALGDSILNKSSILRDLHFKLGGVMDKNGKMVSGNGFLGGQMYQSPEIRRMFKKMVSDSVGRKGGFDQARVKAKEGVKLKINSKTDPILRSMVSLWEGDADGVPFLDKDGDYIPLKKETEEMRATAGLLLIDDQNRRQANGEAISEGQLVYNPDTQTWSGKYLTDDQIRILRLSGRFNNPQIRQLEMLNEAAKATLDPNAAPETRGNRFSIIYQAALKRNKKGKWRYDQIEPSLRDVVPYGVEISKAGNISIRIMSTNQMHANISKKAASKKGVQLYEGNIEAILRDVNKVIELHGEADGKPTDAHFKEKYGAAWESHKAFINSVFGNVGAGHKDINPLVASDKVDAVVKTYRLDRINKATQMVGSTNLPYQNNLVKINYLPEGEPILDENGEPKDLRYTPSYEESQVRMPEAQRAMPEGEQGGDVTLTRLREIRDGLDENLTEREAIDGLDFIINDAPSGYFPQSILNKVDQAKRDLEEEFTTWAGRGDSEASTESAISSVMSFLDSKESRGEAAPTRFMPEVSPEDLNPVANKQEAQGLWADGKRMFALNEMDEKLTPITSKAMLDSYSADAIGWMEPEAKTRFMPEPVPVAKTSDEALQESESGELQSTGVDVPESVDEQSVISNAIKVANSQSWRKGRDFKLEIQRRVLDAAEKAGVKLSERSLESIEYLARVGLKDALIALEQNPNAIGWYDEKTKQALGVMSLMFPEIATDQNARFAFTWALAVTSNGLKVDKNFELAERVYREYRNTGKMPTNIQAGQAQKAINKSLDLFNQLIGEWGIDNTRQFMQTDFTVGEIARLGVVSKTDKKEVKPGGEHSDTIVRGSAILGPKIGNGFFSNLYGLFDALTMDRWLVRTWGRWTGTLVELNPELTQNAKTRLEETQSQLTDSEKSLMDKVIGKDISQMTTEELAFAIQKASMKPKLREAMNATAMGEEFRMAGNGLAKYLDGQKEAPANPAERNFIREIFGLMLDELRADPKYKDLTMADLQAVLWYAEKRLYETAKVKADQDAIDSSDADGYEDDEAPDYANAAIGVARKNGVPSKRINEVLEKIKNDGATITQSSDEGRSRTEDQQQKSAGGFAGKQKQQFKQYVSVSRVRRNRTGNEKALWSYQTRSGVDSGDTGVLKPKAKKNLGVKYISEWKPGRKLSNTFRNNGLPVVKFLELDPSDQVSAKKFADTIQQSKDESPHGAAVYVYPVEDYQGMKLFLSDSGKSGFAVKPDGDIVSVFSMEKGSGRSIMEAAISAGGKKLDAFDTILPEFYGTHGFVEAARIPWNDEFAPDGWDKNAFNKFNNGEPDVVMMVLDPSLEGEYQPRTDIYTTDYDQAVEMQNAMLKKAARSRPKKASADIQKPTATPNQSAPKKPARKSQAKGNASAIANAAKLK